MTEKEFHIWCVRKRKEDDNDVTESMHYAKKVLKEEGFNPQWITENECLKVKKKEKNGVYLFDPFEGPTFDHIKEVGCRIFGPQCIISSLQFKLEIPKRSSPVYNLAMKDLTVCCTSMDKTVRDELHKKVEMMGGVVSKDFTEHVTHLVAGEVGSKKYQVAGSLGKQIMSPKWIEKVWENSQDGHIHGTDSQFHDYRCLVFMGLVITVSGLDSEERTQVKKLVESEGGKYTGEMKVNECTHLIINKPKGSKYEFAKKWGVRIIKSDWLYDSIEKGFCLEENKYELKDSNSDMDETEVKTSTPEKHPAPDRGRSLADISCISNVSMMNINETAAPTDMTRKSLGDMTRKSLCDITRKSLENADETVNQIDLSKQTSDLFLDGCKIYLSGFRGSVLEKLRKVINAGGGTRLNQLNENVTHVIMGEKIEKDVQILKTASFRPHVVTSVWIAECYKQGKTVDEEPFYCFELPALESASPKLKSKKIERRKTSEKEKEVLLPDKQKVDVDMDNDEMEILSQYMLQPNQDNNEAPQNNIEDDDLAQDPDETYQPVTRQKPLNDEESVNQIDMSKQSSDLFLDGCKIYLSGFKGQVLEKLCKVINAGGGTRLNQLNQNVTHVIMGEKIEKDVQILKTASFRPFVVNAAWIAECYKQGNTVDEKRFICLELPASESESGNTKLEKMENRKISETENSPDKQKLENTDAGDVTNVDSRMFSKKVFMFFGFEEEPVSELTEYVTERGGFVIDEKDRRIPDYGIVPIDGFPVNRTVGEIATSAWLQVCLEQEKLLDLNSNPLFTPIDIAMESECLKDCVLCISGYSGTEHDCLMHIAETLGAVCQVYFARTQSKGLLPNTHLILREAEGSKYEAAKKWGIPALSKNWLLKCARTGKRENESEYAIDRKDVSMETDISYQDNCDISMKTVEQNNLPNISLNNSAKNRSLMQSDEQREISKSKSTSTHESTLNACEQMEFSEFESSRNSRNLSKSEKVTTRLSESKKDNSMNIETSSLQNSDGKKLSLRETETKVKLQESQKENCIQQREDVTEKLQHSRLVEIRNELRSATPKNQSLHNASMSTPSPSKCLDVNQPFIPKFDISEAMQLLDTPESQRKQRKLSRRKSSLSLEDYFTKHLEIGLKNIENYVPPSQEDGRVLEGDEERPLEGVVIAVSKKLSSQQAEFNDIVAALGGDYIWTYDKSCTHFIFKGRANDTSKEFKLAKSDKKCIVSPYWIQMCKEQNARVDESLFPHHYNPNLNLSNVVSSKKSETPLRNNRRTPRTPARTPARQARGTSTKTREPVDTKTEPVDNKTEDELVVSDKVTESDALMPETKEVKCANTNEDEEDKQEEQPQEVGQTIEMQEALSKHLENVMAMSKEKMDSQSSRAKKSRRKSKRLDSSGQFNESSETSGSGDRSSARARRSEQDDLKESGSRRSTRSSVKGPESHHSGSEASQSVQVIWDDPTGRLERERLAHKLERACSPTQEVMSNYDELLMENKPEFSDVEDDVDLNIPNPSIQLEEIKQNRSIEERVTTPEAPSIAFPMPKHSTNLEQPEPIHLDEGSRDQADQSPQKPPPVFIFSGLIPQEKDNYAALVEELGGKSSDAQYYDPSCTHLVIGTITRSEKFLASVAAGKWVLHKSYFEACRQENTFVQEDFYEWGGQGTMSLLSNQNPTVVKLAAAAHRWRVQIQEETLSQGSCAGAFNSWKVLLCAGENKEANFRRLLEAGGATVTNIKPPFPANLSCTHALLDLNKVKLTTDDLRNLISAGILCLKPEFISAHLTEDPDKLDHRQYCPPEVKELLSSLSENSRERKRKTSSPLPAADTSSKRLRKK